MCCALKIFTDSHFNIMSITTLTEFQTKCIELLDTAPQNHSKHCFRSALHQLKRAEALIEIDPEMAAFRSITAEEEAASGLLRCLSELGYPRSNELNPHNHTHKHAVFPFMEILGIFFKQTISEYVQNFSLHIKEDNGETRLTLALTLSFFGEDRIAYPTPPLNFVVSLVNSTKAMDYSRQIDEFIRSTKMPSIKTFLKREANLRNKILYASPDGYPTLENFTSDFIKNRYHRVLSILNLYLMIFPYKEHQLYVTQAIEVFVDWIKSLQKSASKHET